MTDVSIIFQMFSQWYQVLIYFSVLEIESSSHYRNILGKCLNKEQGLFQMPHEFPAEIPSRYQHPTLTVARFSSGSDMETHLTPRFEIHLVHFPSSKCIYFLPRQHSRYNFGNLSFHLFYK